MPDWAHCRVALPRPASKKVARRVKVPSYTGNGTKEVDKMAVIHLTTGESQVIPPDKAQQIWQVLEGELTPTKQQQAYCQKVRSINLNWRTAPDSYIKEHLDVIIDMALMDWAIDRQGYLTEPDERDVHAWAFAKKWGLWHKGKPSDPVNKRNTAHKRAIDRNILRRAQWI